MALLGLIGGACDGGNNDTATVQREGLPPTSEHSIKRGLLPTTPTATPTETLDALPTPSPTPAPAPGPTDGPEPTGAPPPPSPGPDPTPAPAPERVEAIICFYPWDCETAIRVFTCESRLRVDAISWNASSYGIAQIWRGHAWRFPGFWEQWMIPEVNIGWAYELWSEQGWGPWRESQSCWRR